MKTWEQHYIEHCIKFAEPWGKRFGLGVFGIVVLNIGMGVRVSMPF